MKNILVMVFVCFFVWKTYDTLKPLKLPDHLAFTDPSGSTHTLDTTPSEPYVIMPWIDNCSYSARSLAAIEQYAQSGAISGQNTFALYLNQISDENLKKHNSVKQSSLVHAAAQKDVGTMHVFYDTLIKDTGYMPGDFFIVGTNGTVEHVKARELSKEEFAPKVSEALGILN